MDAHGFAGPADTLAAHPDFARLTTALQAPQAALRARLNAAILDLILLGVLSQLLAGAVTGARDAQGRALVFLILEFAYFFACELRTGQTLGKRVFHVRVVSADGSPASAGQIALRNALRIFDSLPFFYASGLISLMRTGPGRRQRIGDVAARTTVVLGPNGKALRTPSWLLPVLTLLATLLSLAIIIPALSVRHAGQGPAPALAGEPGPPPRDGEWTASARIVSSVGYGDSLDTSALWKIGRQCRPGAGGCWLSLTYISSRDGPVKAAPLIQAGAVWIATFAPQKFICAQRGAETLYWFQQTTIALRFTAGGEAAEGEERNHSESPQCGYASATRTWRATWIRGL